MFPRHKTFQKTGSRFTTVFRMLNRFAPKQIPSVGRKFK